MKQKHSPIFVLLLLLTTVFTVNKVIAKTTDQSNHTEIAQNSTQGSLVTLADNINSENQSLIESDAIQIQEITKNSFEENSGVIFNQKEVNASIASPIISETYITGFWQGLFYGILILLIVVNFVSFLIFDEKIYLLYGSSLVALAAFLFFSDGLLAFFDMQNLHNVEIVSASFFLITAIASVIFGSHFLNLNNLFPKLKFVATGIFTAASITLISGWFLETEILATISNLLAMTVVFSYFISGVILFSQKTYTKLYVIAMALPLLFTMDYLLSGPFSVSFLHIEIAHIKGAVLVQILMLTYAILYRMREIKEENLIKQTELKIFLKRQEMTSREKTEKHLEDVYLENVIMQYDLDGFEVKLLQFISEGKTNEKIARKLKVSESELEEATNELYQKLEIRERIKEDYHLVESQPDFIYN